MNKGCPNCGGSGVIAHRVAVYEHGCCFAHDDTDERPCSECNGTGKPSCPYCGETEGLRQIHDGGGYTAPEYTCEDCFTPTDTGPCWDDLKPHN